MAADDVAHTLSTELPDMVTFVGVSVAVRFADDGLAVSCTVPLKPPCELMDIVPVLQLPCVTVIVPSLEMLKSWTLKVTLAVWTRLPLVPVTVTTNVPPVAKVQESDEVPLPVTLVGDTAQCVVSLTVRVTVPAKWLTALTVTVELPATFGVVLTGVVANIWKSTTWTDIVDVV